MRSGLVQGIRRAGCARRHHHRAAAWHPVKPGLNVGRGKDDTLFAKVTGRIKFLNKGSMGKFVMVEPHRSE